MAKTETKKATKPVRAKALPIEFDKAGEPYVVLDEPTRDKLRVAYGICCQVSGSEPESERAGWADNVVVGLRHILDLHPPKATGKAPADGAPDA